MDHKHPTCSELSCLAEKACHLLLLPRPDLELPPAVPEAEKPKTLVQPDVRHRGPRCPFRPPQSCRLPTPPLPPLPQPLNLVNPLLLALPSSHLSKRYSLNASLVGTCWTPGRRSRERSSQLRRLLLGIPPQAGKRFVSIRSCTRLHTSACVVLSYVSVHFGHAGVFVPKLWRSREGVVSGACWLCVCVCVHRSGIRAVFESTA